MTQRIHRAILAASSATSVRGLTALQAGDNIEIHGVAETPDARFLAFRMISETVGENAPLVNRIELGSRRERS